MRLLLDIALLAEALREAPNQRVVHWLDAQAVETCFVSAVSLAELLRRIETLPAERRRTAHGFEVGQSILAMFERRVLPFDDFAATAYTKVISMARRAGYKISRQNGLMAAIAYSANLVVASGDTKPFVAVGLEVVNPWLF